MCPTSISELPSEVLEHTASYLPPKDILKMREVCYFPCRTSHLSITPSLNQVSRLFLDLVSSSHHLQHRLNLFSAGLVDNPHFVCSLADRRARLRDYEDGWKRPGVSYQRVHPLNAWGKLNPIGQNLFSTDPLGKSVHFIRIPSLPGQEMAKEWTLKLPFHFYHYTAWQQDNLFAVVEQQAAILEEPEQVSTNSHTTRGG